MAVRLQTGTLEVTGQMVIPVEAGRKSGPDYVRTDARPRTIGGLISFGAGILLMGGVLFGRLDPLFLMHRFAGFMTL